jgi:uncharacterized SAM-binding protein YcdF (DUF218 family)
MTGSPSLRARFGTGLAVGSVAGFVGLDLNLPSLFSYLGDRSCLLVGSALLVALLWLTPLKRALGLLTAMLAALWLVVSFTPLTQWMRDGLVRSDAVQDADAVFVFASRIQSDGEPTPDAMSRLLKGVELVAEGRAPYLVVSEEAPAPPSGPHETLARAWLERFAHRGEVLGIGPISNSHDEAVALARLARERGWKRVLAVTSPTHTRRAAASVEKQGLAVISVPCIETNFDLETLLGPSDRRRAFPAIAHELIGIAVYKRRGWMG